MFSFIIVSKKVQILNTCLGSLELLICFPILAIELLCVFVGSFQGCQYQPGAETPGRFRKEA